MNLILFVALCVVGSLAYLGLGALVADALKKINVTEVFEGDSIYNEKKRWVIILFWPLHVLAGIMLIGLILIAVAMVVGLILAIIGTIIGLILLIIALILAFIGAVIGGVIGLALGLAIVLCFIFLIFSPLTGVDAIGSIFKATFLKRRTAQAPFEEGGHKE